MGYKISYRSVRRLHRAHTLRTGMGALIGIFLLLFLLAVKLFWPEGIEAMRNLILPSDEFLAVSAVEDITSELKQGGSVLEAITKLLHSILGIFDGQN